MWNKSAMFLMVQVKMQGRWGFTFPVPLNVVDELFEAFADLAWVGEFVLKWAPVSKEERARKHLNWLKIISPSGLIIGSSNILKDLRRHRGLDLVNVETGDVQVKVYLR